MWEAAGKRWSPAEHEQWEDVRHRQSHAALPDPPRPAQWPEHRARTQAPEQAGDTSSGHSGTGSSCTDRTSQTKITRKTLKLGDTNDHLHSCVFGAAAQPASRDGGPGWSQTFQTGLQNLLSVRTC